MDAAAEHEPTKEPDPIRDTAEMIFGLSPLPDLGEYFGFTLWRAAWAVTVSIVAARCTHLSTGAAWAVLVAVTMWAVLSAGAVTACAAGVMTWLLGTGFVVHRLGDLSFTAGDRLRLGVTVLLAFAVALIGRRAAARARRPAGVSGVRE